MIGALVFVLGLVIGSFLNVVIFRLYGNDPIFISRSKCFNCGKTLSWYELIPVISFVIQKGRCRSCGFKLSLQYPLVEVLTGIFVTYFYFNRGQDIFNFYLLNLYDGGGAALNFILNILIFSLFLVIFFYDIRNQIIPNVMVYPLILLGFALQARHYYLGFAVTENLIAALAIAIFFFFLWLISKGSWMGLGDAKLILATSLFLGFERAPSAFLFSFWVGAIYALPLLFLKKVSVSSRIPFGPFIILGFLLSLFYQLRF